MLISPTQIHRQEVRLPRAMEPMASAINSRQAMPTWCRRLSCAAVVGGEEEEGK